MGCIRQVFPLGVGVGGDDTADRSDPHGTRYRTRFSQVEPNCPSSVYMYHHDLTYFLLSRVPWRSGPVDKDGRDAALRSRHAGAERGNDADFRARIFLAL